MAKVGELKIGPEVKAAPKTEAEPEVVDTGIEVEWRNPVYCDHDHGRMNIEVNHPVYGWIPFTLDPHDTGAPFDTAELFQEILESEAPVADYDGPSPLEAWRAGAVLRWPDFLRACVRAGILTAAEIPVAASNQVPESMKAKINDDDFAVDWALADVVERNGTIAQAIGTAYEMNDDALDRLFGRA